MRDAGRHAVGPVVVEDFVIAGMGEGGWGGGVECGACGGGGGGGGGGRG